MAPVPNKVVSSDPSSPETNTSEHFQAVHTLYKTLAQRQRQQPIFLPRTLRRDLQDYTSEDNSPWFCSTLSYVEYKHGSSWSRRLPEPRCLWCGDSFYRFPQADELLHHLRTFHCNFSFSSMMAVRRTAPFRSGLIVSIQLPHKEHASWLSSDCAISDYDKEFEHVNLSSFLNPVRRRMRTRTSPSHRCILLHDSSRASRVASRAARGSVDLGIKNECIDKKRDADYRPTRFTKRVSEGKRKRKTGNPAFTSISAAVQKDRLYHSVLQQRLSVKRYDDGADSDAESDDQEELQWRSRIVEDEIEEYVDTIAVEKLFMCLWNQFTKMEHPIRADRDVAPACLRFVQLYRKTLKRYSLELTFLRHLTEFTRMGVLDADSVFETVQVLRNRDMSGASDGRDEPRFLYAERLKSEGADGKRIRYQ